MINHEYGAPLTSRIEGNRKRLDCEQRNTIPSNNVGAFLKLFDTVAADLGSNNRACERLKVSYEAMHKARTTQVMTPLIGRRILDGYRSWKKSRGKA